MKVLMLIGRFDVGGIQRQVSTTAAGLVERGHEVLVLSVYPNGRFADDLRARGIDVRSLQRVSRRDIHALIRGIGVVREFAPDVLYCYHVLPNLLGLVYHLCYRRAGLIWGLRATDIERHGLLKRTQFRISRFFANVPDAIIANSQAVRDFHIRSGYPPGAITVIPNGIDTLRFAPDPVQREAVRAELGLDDEDYVIGVVGQFREKKGHVQFLEALPSVLDEQERVVALVAGDGRERWRLEQKARALELTDVVHWLGYRRDMEALYNAMDLLCLPSTFGEGFPNVLGEALACGVPVVATDVGGAKDVVGPHGMVVEAASAPELARAILWGVRRRMSGDMSWPLVEASARINREYSLGTLVDRTERLLREVVDQR